MLGKTAHKNFAGAMPTGHLLQPLPVATVPSLLLKLPQLLPQLHLHLHLHLLLPQRLRLLHLLPHLHPQLPPKSLTLLTLSLTSTKLC